MVKNPLNFGSSCKLPWSIMSTHHCNRDFLLASVRCGLMLFEWRLRRPFFKYLCSFHLLMFSFALTSSIVILSLRGMLRNGSKSTGIALRPTLPFFWLATLTGMDWARGILPRCHKRWATRMWSPNCSATTLVSHLPSFPFLLLANKAWYTYFLSSSVMSLAFLRPLASTGASLASSSCKKNKQIQTNDFDYQHRVISKEIYLTSEVFFKIEINRTIFV